MMITPLRTISIASAAVFSSLAFCAASQSAAPHEPPPSALADDAAQRLQHWNQDLTALVVGLKNNHKNPFFKIAQTDFESAAEQLRSRLNQLPDHAITVEFMKLAAMLGDGHTGVDYSGAQPPFRPYPLAIITFTDGVYVFATTPEHRELLAGKIVRIGSMPIEDATARVSAVFAADNEPWRQYSLRRFINIAEILNATGIVDDMERAAWTIIDREGREQTVVLSPLAPGQKPSLITAQDDIKDSLPISRQARPQWYWFEKLPQRNVIYCRYDRCADQPNRPVAAFAEQLLAAIDENPQSRLIIDLRNNGGGNSALLDPLIDKLKQRRDRGALPKVAAIVGRATFSSAQLNAAALRDKVAAIIVGEPTGQKPNAYGEVRTFKLPNSGLTVSYSTKFFKTDPNDPESMMPDVTVDFTAGDFFAGRDPAFDAAVHAVQSD